METHRIAQIQHEARQLLDLRALLNRTSKRELIKICRIDMIRDLSVDLDYTRDNACYRAVEEALKMYADEITRKLSRAAQI